MTESCMTCRSELWGSGDVSLENQDNYRMLVELSQDAVVIHDAAGIIRFVNRAGWKTLGANGPKALIGCNLFEFVHPKDLKVVQQRITRISTAQSPVEAAVHRIIALDGREIYLESVGGPFVLDGEPCIQVVCRDVTQRVQMERELKKERDTLEKVISLNPIPIFLYDQEGRYVRGNQAYLDLFGAVPPPDYCFFEDPVLIRAGFQDALNKLKNGSPTQIDEVWYNARDVDAEAPDRSLCLSFSGFPVYSEERLISYVCMLRDITAQKIAQEELRISEEKFSKAFHSSPMIMVVTRLHDGKLIDFNEAFERFIGSNRDGLLGKTSLEVGLWERPEDRKRFVDALLRGDLPLQSIIRRRSGERRVGRFFGERLTIGRETCLLAVIEDITEQLESEEALRLSQESYRQLFDSVTELISVHDPENGAILDVNRAWVDTMGYTKEEVLGKGLEIISCEKPPYTVKNALKGFANARKEGFKATECLTKTKDGRLVWNEVALKPASIGGRESIIAVVRNITERKAMEAQLNREREMLEHIIDMNPYAIAFYDHEGRLFRTNEAFNQLYHTSSFRNYSLFEDPVLAGQGYKESLRALREGQPVSIPSFRDNPRWRREDLPDIPKTLRGVAFPVRPFDNAPATYVAMIEDLTELDSTRNALEESNKKYRSVLENSNDGIVLLQGGSVRYANPKISAMIGVPVRDLLNRPFVDCIPSQDSAHILKLVQARDDQESGAATIETSLVQRDGLRVDVEITTNTIPFEGESAHLVVFRDITERKIYEKRIYQGQKMEAIGTLAGGIAHDFNNILTPILGFTEMTMSGLDPKEKPYQDLGQVLKAGQRAQDLVKQILAFSRQRTYEKKPFQVAPLVAEVTKLLRASLPTTIDIKVDLPRNIRPIIADPTGVHQILMNLCTNAYHAMRDQGGVLSLIFEETEVVPGTKDEWGDTAPGVYLRMAVCDTGHGMEKDVLDKIFHPYFTTKPEGEGTGMGLAVVHGIVKSHQGRIRVYSEPGKGTAFHVFLPMFDGLEADAGDLPVSLLSDPDLRGRDRILVVDDEESILAMVQKSLTDLGYEVTACARSSEAFHAFRQNPYRYDLVITDQTMPGMTGIELAEKAMDIRPDIPVVLLTGYGEIATRENAKALGVREFLMKPVMVSQLAKAIRRVLDIEPRSKAAEG